MQNFKKEVRVRSQKNKREEESSNSSRRLRNNGTKVRVDQGETVRRPGRSKF